MPTHALLGATGSTGSAILRSLLASPQPDLHLEVLVRSKSKLLKSFPDLENSTAFKLSIQEAQINDTAAMQQCLLDAEVIHMCVATNEAKRGTSVAEDTAKAIVAALNILKERQGPSWKIPTILILRSDTLNPTMRAKRSWLQHQFIYQALYYVYSDLERACQIYVSAAESGLLDYIYVDPPALHDADGTEPTGYVLDLHEERNAVLSYADLGASFVEIAGRRDEFKGQGVGVFATGKVNLTWGVLVGYIGMGARQRLIGM